MGDGGLVLMRPEGTFLAVVDGIGHGGPAEAAARAALELLRQLAGPDLSGTLIRCHDALKATRGATMGLAWVNRVTATLSWLGVGNVSGVLHPNGSKRRASAPYMPQFGGVVGRRLRPLEPSTVPIEPGDTIVLATDGLRRAVLGDAPPARWSESAFAERLVETHANGQDDAYVLVARVAEDA